MKRLPRKIKKIAKSCYAYETSESWNYDNCLDCVLHNLPKHGIVFVMMVKKKPYCKLVVRFGKKMRYAYREGMLDF